MSDYDVIVVGGGPAGICAAVQAARAGVRTLLVEKNGLLGGTLTAGGVNFPGLFHAWGEQVIAGIGWDLVRRAVGEAGDELPDFAAPEHPRRHVIVNKAIFAALADEAVVDAGCELLFHALPYAAAFEGGAWRVDLATKDGPRPRRSRALVDCTGDANVVALAGFELLRHEPSQPGSLVMQLSGYDPDELDFGAIDAAFREALAAGEIRHTDVGWRTDGPAGFLRNRGVNANHIASVRADNSEGRTQAELEGRRSMMRAFRFLRRQPGLEKLRIDYVAPECGIRETTVIRGKQTVTVSDYLEGRPFADAVCYSFYPIDIHLGQGRGIDLRPLAEGVVPSIPRGAMLPAGSRFLLVAGRCISGDKEAHSAYRVEASCMATGQAAGAMAALSARTGIDPEKLPLQDIHGLLREHGAIVPDEPGR